MARGGISHKWQILLAFFLGGAISSIAQDPSDTLFFVASSKGQLGADAQAIYWYWVPFFIYMAFFALGYSLARLRRVSPVFVLYMYLAIEVFSTFVSLGLPQTSSYIYLSSVLVGTAVSVGVIFGLKRHVR